MPERGLAIMTCYQCSHCNKCGIFSLRMELTCNTCGAMVVAGTDACPECDSPYKNNTTRGGYTKVDNEQGSGRQRKTG